MIIYLHGFRSSPMGFKAQLLAAHFQKNHQAWYCPQLPMSPKLAIELVEKHVASVEDPTKICLIGSSLGGFYTNYLAEQWGCKAVLLNPAIHAQDKLHTQVSITEKDALNPAFLPEYLDELQAFDIIKISQPKRYLLVACTGDEVLDWRQMRDHYTDCAQLIIPGSDHQIRDFAQWMPQVLQFIEHN